jgi:hypothetical protein
MIGLIDAFFYNLSLNHNYITTAHNQWLLKTRSFLAALRLSSLLVFLLLWLTYEWLLTYDCLRSSRVSCCDRRYVGIKHPTGVYDQIFITVRHLRVCWIGAPSLMRGRVCRLKLLLALASAVILGSESRGTRDHNLMSQISGLSFFVASYDSQGYGGVIRPHVHTGWTRLLSYLNGPLYSLAVT